MSFVEDMTAIADTVREKTGFRRKIYLDEFIELLTSEENSISMSEVENDALIKSIWENTITTFRTEEDWGEISLDGPIFSQVTSLEEAYLSQVKKIGTECFYGCTNLQYLDAPDVEEMGTRALKNTALTSITLPSVKRIGAEAFSMNLFLESIELPEDVVFLNTEYLCYKCPITSAPFIKTLKEIGNSCFGQTLLTGEISLPKTTLIGNLAFQLCNITSVDAPELIETGSSAFEDCAQLESFYAPKLQEIGALSFSGTKLKEIDLTPVISIGGGAFAKIGDITFKNSPINLTFVGSEAFKECNSIPYLADWSGVKFNSRAFSYTNLREMELNGVNGIDTMFGYNKNLVKIKLTNFYSTSYTFTGCGLLEEIYVDFLNSCSVDNSWISNSDLSSLKVLSFSNATGVGSLSRCPSLEKIVIRDSNVCPLRTSSALNSTAIGSERGAIYVPKELVNEYKNASNWTKYADKIYAIEEEE